MPKDKKSESPRMVVEEVELPAEDKTETPKEEEKPEVKESIIEETKVETPETKPEETAKPEEEKPEQSVEPPAPVETPPVTDEPKKEKSPVFWILIPGIFILGAILGGIIFYQKQVSTDSTATEATSTPQPTTAATTETPSPSSEPDITEYDIAVYNGSGIAGEAGSVQTLLEDAGFNVVSTGNAATYDYTKTIIKAKSTVEDAVITKLTDALSESYVVGDNQTLSSTATTDIQVVVGSSKAE